MNDNSRVLIGLLSLFFIIIMIFVVGNNTDQKSKEIENAYKKKYDKILSEFDFKLDTIKINSESDKNIKSFFRFKKNSKILPLILVNTTYLLDTALYRTLPDNLKSCQYNDLSYFLLKEYVKETISYYSNNKTRAVREDTKLKVYSIRLKSIIYEITITGGDPPDTYKYHHEAPDFISGARVSNQDIIRSIINLYAKN